MKEATRYPIITMPKIEYAREKHLKENTKNCVQ